MLGPQTAEGVTATVSGEGADVSFGDTVLAVEEFETRRISPVAAPYLLSKAWSEGYISQCGKDGELETAEYTLGYRGGTAEYHHLVPGGSAPAGGDLGREERTDHLRDQRIFHGTNERG